MFIIIIIIKSKENEDIILREWELKSYGIECKMSCLWMKKKNTNLYKDVRRE